MKILQLAKNYYPDMGGIESVTFDLTEGLNDLNIRCDVLCSSHENKTIIDKRKSYTIFRAATLYQAFATSLSPVVLKKIRQLKNSYDIIHVHFPNPMTALALFLVRPKNKILIHWHSDIVRQRFLYPLFRPLEKWVLKRADVITGTSLNYIERSQPLKNYRDKTIPVPIGIDSARFHNADAYVSKIKGEYQGKRIVFSLGRLVYYKGFEYLIEAGKFLDDNTIVLIGGTGELGEKLQVLIDEHDLNEKVKLLGRIPEDILGSYYKACDIFCLPSVKRSEAFGVVQLESMLFGKPVVSTEIPGSGVSWVNQNGITGKVVPVCDAKALAGAINEILADNEMHTRFSTNALKRFNQYFTRDHMIRSYIEIYRNLLSKPDTAKSSR